MRLGLAIAIALLMAGAASAQTTSHIYTRIGPAAGDTTSCKDAKIIVTLMTPDSGFTPFDTSTSAPIPGYPIPPFPVDSSKCIIRMDLVPNTYIRPFGSWYRFTCRQRGQDLWTVDVSIPDTTIAELHALDRAED